MNLLYCIVLYFIALHCIALHCIVGLDVNGNGKCVPIPSVEFP